MSRYGPSARVWYRGLLGLALSLLAPSVAHARGPATTAGSAPDEPCPCPGPGARRHDGFFVRAEASAALLRASVRGALDAPGRSAAEGIGQASAVRVGMTPARGLVLGASLWAARIDPAFVEDGVRVVPDDDSVKWTVARVGPFASFYPDPRRGFHADLALSLVLSVESDTKGKPLEPGAAGPGFSVSVGHDWFVGAELSLGVFARAAFARTSRQRDGARERTLSEVLELGVAYTYH